MSEQTEDERFRFWMATAICLITLIMWRPVSAFCNAQPDGYEPDNSPGKATVTLVYISDAEDQHHGFHNEEDEDWVEFCALPGESYEIEGTNVGSRSELGLELYDTDGKTMIMSEYWADGNGVVRLDWRCKKSGAYYVRVTPNDPSVFGKGTQYDLAIYIPGVPPGSGNMTGLIRDSASRKPVPQVKMSTSGKAFTWYNSRKGDYVLSDTVGSYTITLIAAGYRTFNGKIEIIDSKTVPKDYDLVALQTPDLVITAVSGPAEAIRGQPVSVLYTVGNQGKAGAGAFKIGIYLSKDRTIKPGQDRLIGSRKVPGQAAGASSTATTKVKIPADVTPGAYYLGAVADYGGSVAEGGEDNNAMASKKTVQIR